MPDKREEILKPYVFKMDEREVVREGDAIDAMDEYTKQTCLELLEYISKNCIIIGTFNDYGSFYYKGEWITKEQLFENFL